MLTMDYLQYRTQFEDRQDACICTHICLAGIKLTVQTHQNGISLQLCDMDNTRLCSVCKKVTVLVQNTN